MKQNELLKLSKEEIIEFMEGQISLIETDYEERIDELTEVIHQQDLEKENLMVELKYNRMAVKYLTDTNKIMLEELRLYKKGDK